MATNNQLNVGLSGSSGTGSFVGTNSPTITTPKIDNILDTNGNTLLLLTTTASAVNYVNVANNTTGLGPIINAAGSNTNIILNLNGKGTGGVNAQGTSTNDNATAGYIGEFITSAVTSGASISNNTNTNISSISLTPGDWTVWGNVNLLTASTTVLKQMNAWISSSSTTFPASYSLVQCIDYGSVGISNVGAGVNVGISVAPLRFSLSATTTVYIECLAIFTTSTATTQGFISARRTR